MTDYTKISKIDVVKELLDLKEQNQNLLDDKERLEKQFSLYVVVSSAWLILDENREIQQIFLTEESAKDHVNELKVDDEYEYYTYEQIVCYK